jgi:hypothetical protein
VDYYSILICTCGAGGRVNKQINSLQGKAMETTKRMLMESSPTNLNGKGTKYARAIYLLRRMVAMTGEIG